MRRRLMFATMSAVMAAVVLLGIPLAVFAAQQVRDDTRRELESRVVTIARALDVRISAGERIQEDNIQTYVGGRTSREARIAVTLPGGEQFTVGPESSRYFSASHITDSGVVVIMYVSWWDVFWDAAGAVAVVVVIGLSAIAVSVMIASWQANRLSKPLVLLAASAEQLGAGQVRKAPPESGVEEIDLVAEELVRSANRMAARLSAERQFSSDASHQLRTPLTALSMRLEEIIATSKQESVRDEAEKSLEQVERLVGTVHELLGRTRKSLGGSTEMVPLSKLMRQQREEWQPAFVKADRELILPDTDVTVFATPGGLAQVLATLIENSLVHGGGTTTLSVRESSASHAVVIEVRDEGEGVSDELATRVFEREVTSGRGTGLGLALARDLVAADGGRLELAQRRPAVFAVFLQGMPRMVSVDQVIPHARRRRRRRAR